MLCLEEARIVMRISSINHSFRKLIFTIGRSNNAIQGSVLLAVSDTIM